jgi:hypothetical protein
MNEALGFSPSTYGLAAGAFSLGYALAQVGPTAAGVGQAGTSDWVEGWQAIQL